MNDELGIGSELSTRGIRMSMLDEHVVKMRCGAGSY